MVSTLPDSVDATPVPERERPKSSPGRRRRILVIDDDLDQVATLRRRLTQLEYEVRAAHDGHHGLEEVREFSPDLILLDLRLPDIDGFQVCQVLADGPRTCCIPIIILSGLNREDVVRSCRAAGCTYYLAKPYDPNALLALIEQAFLEGAEDDYR